MRDKDRQLLLSILAFANKVERRMTNLSFEAFLENDDIQEAILYALGQMGEKVNHLSAEFREQYPRDEWYGLIGLRNRIFHSYEDITMDIVYKVAKEQTGQLIALVSHLLEGK